MPAGEEQGPTRHFEHLSIAVHSNLDLGAFYAPSLLVLWLTALFFISRYRIDKEGHEANLRKLAEARKSATG